MEKSETSTEDKPQQQPYPPHLKKVLKTYQRSAIKSLQGPNTILHDDPVIKKECVSESSPELPLETPPLPPPVQQFPFLSVADQSAELSETMIEGHKISCFIIGGEKRICFVQLLSTVLRNVNASTINNVCAELFINFSSCNCEQLSALKAKGLLPPETPTCGLVTKPDAERLCSVLLHEGALSPFNFEKYSTFSIMVYHDCFSGAKGILYADLYTERNWCIQCAVCRRFFTPQMFVCHSCYLDKKRNTVHTYIETGVCHWGFESSNWKIYLRVCYNQPDYDKCKKILGIFKENHKGATVVMLPVKRKQVHGELYREPVVKNGATSVLKHSRDVDDEERYIIKKKTKIPTQDEASPPLVGATTFYHHHPSSFQTYYNNLCESWVRSTVATYHPAAATWPSYAAIAPFTKDSKASASSYYLSDTMPPAYLAQGAPVLVHPERVVSMSQSEQYERSYQPNVSLAPHSDSTCNNNNDDKDTTTVIKIKEELDSFDEDYSSQENFNVENEKETMHIGEHEEKLCHTPPASPVENGLENGISSVVDQVAAVLDALSDAEDAVRQRVIHLVERLTVKIDKGEMERQRYQDEIAHLRSKLADLREENVQLFYDNNRLRQQLDKTNSLYSNPSSHVSTPKQPHCSPVSVITSPTPSTRRAESVSS